MGSTRIKGKKLRLTIDGVDHWADITSCSIKHEEASSDVVTFEDADAGGATQAYLDITAIQSTDSASFWSDCWDNTGETVPFVYAPHGNETPTTSQPHFTGSCTIGLRPDVGGDANQTYTFQTRFNVDGAVTKKMTA